MSIVVTACFRRETRWVVQHPDVKVVRTSMGVRAVDRMEAFVDRSESMDLLISTGFCGGLVDGLETGDLVLADEVRTTGAPVAVSADLVDRAHRALERAGCPVRVGPIETSDAVLDVAGKRASAVRDASDTRRALGVDMESGRLARWAAKHGVPFLVCRSVLDPVTVEPVFRTDRPLWCSVVRHPLGTWTMARRSATAGRSIGRAIDALRASELSEGVSR